MKGMSWPREFWRVNLSRSCICQVTPKTKAKNVDSSLRNSRFNPFPFFIREWIFFRRKRCQKIGSRKWAGKFKLEPREWPIWPGSLSSWIRFTSKSEGKGPKQLTWGYCHYLSWNVILGDIWVSRAAKNRDRGSLDRTVLKSAELTNLNSQVTKVSVESRRFRISILVPRRGDR